MAGTKRGGLLGRHLAQALGALPGEALDLLRVAVVGHGPDEEIAGAYDAARGRPAPGVDVGIALAVVQFEHLAADSDVEAILIERVGRDRRQPEGGIGVGRLRLDRAAELPSVERGDVAGSVV